jgi:hypothetical protein
MNALEFTARTLCGCLSLAALIAFIVLAVLAMQRPKRNRLLPAGGFRDHHLRVSVRRNG